MAFRIIIFVLCFSTLGFYPTPSQAEEHSPIDVVEQHKITGEAKLYQVSDEENSLLNYTACGGVIDMTEANVPFQIKYKVNETYNDNEMCVWTINNVLFRRLNFRKIKSDFEVPFDFLQILDDTSHTIMGTIPGEELFTMETAVGFVLIIFSADNSVTGLGFALEITAEGEPFEPYVYRGFYSQSSSGSMSLRPYFNNLISTFVNSPVNADSAQLDVKYNLGGYLDFIFVTVLERNGGVIRANFLGLLEGNGTQNFEANYFTTFALFFASWRDPVGEGVTLEWTSNGDNKMN